MKALQDGTCPTGEIGISHLYFNRNKDFYSNLFITRNLICSPLQKTTPVKICLKIHPTAGEPPQQKSAGAMVK